MTILNYLTFLRDNKGLPTFMDLAQDMNVSYNVMNSYINGTTQRITPVNLKKFLDYENKGRQPDTFLSSEEVIFKSMADNSIKEIVSERTLIHLIRQGENNQAFFVKTFNRDNRIMMNNDYYFGGFYYKKRASTSFTLVDDWEYLKKEHWSKKYQSVTNMYYSDNVYSESNAFSTLEEYYLDVLYFAIRKANSFERPVINYDLIFSNEEEERSIEQLISNLRPHFRTFCFDLKEELKYENVCHPSLSELNSIESLYYKSINYENDLHKFFPYNEKMSILKAARTLISCLEYQGDLLYCQSKLDLDIQETDISIKEMILKHIDDLIEKSSLPTEMIMQDYLRILAAYCGKLNIRVFNEVNEKLESVRSLIKK